MQEYVVIHFNDEERFQEEIGYPELKSIELSTPSFVE